jgi:Putative addiction module component
LASLSTDPASMESPAWHEEELAERERKIESRETKFVDWKRAKADIRRRNRNSIESLLRMRLLEPILVAVFEREIPILLVTRSVLLEIFLGHHV